MKTSLFHYDLPEELIAQTPSEKRDESRLLVLDKCDGTMEHKQFKDIIDYLKAGDTLVLNETRVLPARIYGIREETGGAMELLLLKSVDGNTWEALTRPARRAKVGRIFDFGDGALKAEVVKELDEGRRHVKLHYDGILEEVLDRIGTMPLPPYIHEELEEQGRYQTVYAKSIGSAAAPTAGLHFTDDLLKRIDEKGIQVVKVLLHVGLGTFRPVKVDNIHDHKMHSEHYEVTEEAAQRINDARKAGGRIICVGTTSIRTLESVSDDQGIVHAGEGETEIFIYPGYTFKAVDALITNFHLPESTLLMLVSALSTRENILNAYKTAVDMRYRFFSFGDAMFIK